jgi:hypothetical protein
VSGVRGRRITAILATGLLAVAAAGCGGDDSLAPQVPGAPADVTVPDSGQSPAEAAASAQDRASGDSTTGTGDTSTPNDSSTGDTGTTGTGTTGTDTGGTSTGDTGGGTAAPDTGTDSPQNDTAPPAGSDAQQFEDFCAQNPGAC